MQRFIVRSWIVSTNVHIVGHLERFILIWGKDSILSIKFFYSYTFNDAFVWKMILKVYILMTLPRSVIKGGSHFVEKNIRLKVYTLIAFYLESIIKHIYTM